MHAKLVIIGSGIAGLSAAIRAREEGLNDVVVVTRDLRGGSSWKAQGGIAVPIDSSDVESHVNDTLAAGRHLNNGWVVWGYIEFARESLNWLCRAYKDRRRLPRYLVDRPRGQVPRYKRPQ